MSGGTVFNYETARWLEIHHKHRAASSTKQKVSDQKMQQLQEMFSSLDNDGGGEIEIGELQIAMSFLGLDQEQPVCAAPGIAPRRAALLLAHSLPTLCAAVCSQGAHPRAVRLHGRGPQRLD